MTLDHYKNLLECARKTMHVSASYEIAVEYEEEKFFILNINVDKSIILTERALNTLKFISPEALVLAKSSFFKQGVIDDAEVVLGLLVKNMFCPDCNGVAGLL